MKPAQQTRKEYKAMLSVMAIFMAVCIVELTGILLLNHGQFMFTLDDPYIHLALAENIWQGHYGINSAEYAAPSSSILWPFLIAPLTQFFIADWLVFFLNIVCGMATLFFAAKALQLINDDIVDAITGKTQIFLLVLFMLATNMAGLVFIGMEHNLQVLFAVIVAWGLLKYLQEQQVSLVMLLAIIAAPLVRYENAIISSVALLFLFLQKEYAKSLLSGFLIVLACIMFSVFLLNIGLHYLPDSILAKSGVAASGVSKMLGNLANNFMFPNTPKAIAMLLMAFTVGVFASDKNQVNSKRCLAGLTVIALLLHLLGGRIGWYFRYETGIWAFTLILFFYLYKTSRQDAVNRVFKLSAKVMAGVVLVLALLESIVALGSTPLAASNIYHQQFQLHRFITEIYKKPVAVNDLGWASYRNNNYVLDLWGLGSGKARELRMAGNNVQWMDDLANEHNIELAMIYHHATWFPEVPANWIKVAEMDIVGPKITAWYPVSFFVRNEKSAAEIRILLQQFSLVLPEGSQIKRY